jgi:hypothetical protein
MFARLAIFAMRDKGLLDPEAVGYRRFWRIRRQVRAFPALQERWLVKIQHLIRKLVFKFSAECKQGVVELLVIPVSRFSRVAGSEVLKNTAPLTIRGHTFNALGKAEKSEHVTKLSSAWLRDMLNPLDESIVVGKYLLPII